MTNIWIHSDIGPRDNLEDAAMATTVLGPGGEAVAILTLCDGVGGRKGGEIASATAVASAQASLSRFAAAALLSQGQEVPAMERAAAAIRQALFEANDAVLERAAREEDTAGMATTAVCAVIIGSTLVLGWAGDSRGYLYSRSQLCRVTDDHTEVASLLARGLLTPEEAMDHPGAHTVTQYLGKPDAFKPQLVIRELEPGDLLLVCTDGLTDVLPDAEIASSIAARTCGGSDEPLAVSLVRRALEAGTGDNTTVLLYCHRPNGIPACPPERRTLTHQYATAVAAKLASSFKGNNYASSKPIRVGA